MTTYAIRPKLTMSKMGVKKLDPPIKDSSFGIHRLDTYRQLWDGLSNVRKESEKSIRYFNGDQWHEKTTDKYGRTIREDDNIMAQGKIPLKQNLIKSTLRALEGQFRTDTSKSIVSSRTPEKQKESEMLSNALQYSLVSVNNAKDKDARLLEEFLCSGMAIQRISWDKSATLKRREVKLKSVNRNSIFFNGDIADIDGEDIRIIGRLIDVPINSVILDFGTTPERTEELRKIYNLANLQYYTTVNACDPELMYNKDFYLPRDISMCRVIEVWEKRLVQQLEIHDWMDGSIFFSDWTMKELNAANALRISKYAELGVPEEEVPIMEGTAENMEKWFYTYYSPYGHILKEGETPFEHGSHPFVTLFYPLLDGKITGLAADLIDAQRQINRLLILQDMILSSSVKNTLIVDENTLNGQTIEEVGEKYKQIGGVIALNLKLGQGVPPVEIKGSIGNLGIAEMIQIYLRMLQDVSGVNPAMQGQVAASGTSGKLYDAQISQSTLNSKDIMDTFSGLFRRNRDMKLLKTIQQYWDDKRMIAVSGKSYAETAQLYDPDRVKNIDFDLTIGQAADSPVYRSIIEDTLTKFVEVGIIDLTTFLENTTLPFSEQMLESLRKRKEQAQTDPQGAVNGLAQDAQQAGVGGNQQVINKVSEGLKAA